MNTIGGKYRTIQFQKIPEEQNQTTLQNHPRFFCYAANPDEDLETYLQRVEVMNKKNEETLKKLINKPNLLKFKLEEKQKKVLEKKIKVDEQRQKENEEKRIKLQQNEQNFEKKQQQKKQLAQKHFLNKEEASLQDLFQKKYQERKAKENQRQIMASCGLYNLNQNKNDNFQSYQENQDKLVSNAYNKSNQDKQDFLQTMNLNQNQNEDKKGFYYDRYIQSILKENGHLANQKKNQKRSSLNKINSTQNIMQNLNQQNVKNTQSQINFNDKNFPLNSLETRKQILESEKSGQMLKLPGFGIEKTPYYKMEQAKCEQKQRNKEKQDFLLGSQKYFSSKEGYKHINYQNIYGTIKNLKETQPTRNGINRSAQMIEKQFSLNNKLGQIVNSQYDDLVYQDLGVQLETDRQYNNDDIKYQY